MHKMPEWRMWLTIFFMVPIILSVFGHGTLNAITLFVAFLGFGISGWPIWKIMLGLDRPKK